MNWAGEVPGRVAEWLVSVNGFPTSEAFLVLLVFVTVDVCRSEIKLVAKCLG